MIVTDGGGRLRVRFATDIETRGLGSNVFLNRMVTIPRGAWRMRHFPLRRTGTALPVCWCVCRVETPGCRNLQIEPGGGNRRRKQCQDTFGA